MHELRYLAQELGVRGIEIGTHVEGEEIAAACSSASCSNRTCSPEEAGRPSFAARSVSWSTP